MPSIECILHGSLEDSLPSEANGNRVDLQFEDWPSINELLVALKIDSEYLQFALADGHYIEIGKWDEPVKTGRVQLWPRISGG